MYIDVSEGSGGKAGTHGTSGGGGNSGSSGSPGAAGSWYEYIGAGQTMQSVERRGRPGRGGKVGKKGKAGKPPTSKPSKNGLDGEAGKVSICIYDNTGLIESSGTPYRVVLNKKELARLNPKPIIYGALTTAAADPFVYGQEIEFGPALPINIGGLASPDSTLVATLFLNFPTQKFSRTTVPFPSIPGEKDTRYGELSPSATQTVKLAVPKLKHSGYFLDENFWPWPSGAAFTPVAAAKFVAEFAVDGITMRKSKEDGENLGYKEFPVTVDIPFEIVSQAVRHPPSIAMHSINQKGSEVTISFTLRNKLKCAKLNSADCTFCLRIAAMRFRPDLSGTMVEVRQLPAVASENGFLKVKATGFLNDLSPQGTQQVNFTLRLPTNGHENLVEPGAQIVVRAELLHEEYMASFTTPSIIRVAPPLPVAGGASPFDVLVFSNYSMVIEDYRILVQLFNSVGMRVFFLDCDHFRDTTSGRLPRALWQEQFGKSTLLWLPPTPAAAAMVPDEDLFAHVQAGGGLIYGAAATFRWMNPTTVRSALARKAVKVEGPAASLNHLRTDGVLGDKSVKGLGVSALLAATMCALTAAQKLKYLHQKNLVLSTTTVGDLAMNTYTSQPDTGCCSSGKMKVVPLARSPCTLLDLLLVSLRTEFSIDLKLFASSMSFSECVALDALVSFCGEHLRGQVNGNGNGLAAVARDISAAANAAHLFDEKLFTGKPATAWGKHRPAVLAALNACTKIADDAQLDYKPVGERLKDVDVVPGFSQRKRGMFSGADAINLVNGAVQYVTQF